MGREGEWGNSWGGRRETTFVVTRTLLPVSRLRGDAVTGLTYIHVGSWLTRLQGTLSWKSPCFSSGALSTVSFSPSPPLGLLGRQVFLWALSLPGLRSNKVRVYSDLARGWWSCCIAQYANCSAVRDPASFFGAQVFVWWTHCQGTSCHHVNGWCSSLGTAVSSLSSLFDPLAQYSAARLLSLAARSDICFWFLGSARTKAVKIKTGAEGTLKVFMSH